MIQDRYVINDIGGFFTKTSGVKLKKRKIIIMECAFFKTGISVIIFSYILVAGQYYMSYQLSWSGN